MKINLLILSVLLSFSLFAQEKKVLTFDEMLSWNSIKSKQITNNGEYVVYEMGPLVGDGQVIIYNIEKQANDTLKLASGFTLSPDANFLTATQKVPYQELRQAKLDKVKKDKMPKDSTFIYHFETKQLLKFPKLDSALVASKEGVLAAVLFKQEEKKDTSDVKAEAEAEVEVEAEAEAEVEAEAEETDTIAKPEALGKLLVVYNGETGDTVQIQSVMEYTISAKNNVLAYIQSYKIDTITKSTVNIWQNNTVDTIFSTEGKTKKLVFSEDGDQLVFLNTTDTSKVKNYSLYYSVGRDVATLAVDSTENGMPKGWTVSDNGKISFNKDGSRLFVGTTKINEEEPKDTLTSDEKPTLDVWSWTDKRLQPEQLVNRKKDEKKTYTAVWNIENGVFVQLEDEEFSSISLTPKRDNEFALVGNDKPYLRETNWTGLWREDLALVNMNTGKRTDVTQAQFRTYFSKAGKYVLWFSDADTSFYAYSVDKGTVKNISAAIPFKVYNELEDHPIIPSAYGIAGWTPNDENVLVYDRYDIWKIDPSSKGTPVCVTNGFGRENKVKLRLVDLDKEDEFVNLNEALLVKGHNEKNNASSFYYLNAGKKKPLKSLLEDDFYFSTPVKAKNADKLLWSKSNVTTYPDLLLSDLKLKKTTKITEANPQQSEYNWGTVEPYSWTSFRGETLNGLIYKPENFDAQKQYPMIVYYYERSFDRQHSHRIPSPSRSVINPTFYASNGYLVFVPDITYVDGYPGQSAYDCIISGVKSLTSQYKWIDEKHMGLQGQSWGGYQTAYLVTQTDMFAAAMGGAVVSNMTSAYGGIRWKSGLNRMFQYEKTQSRIGGTLWEMPMQYIDNSPLFHAPKVNTPILLMHNDKDGAVPWYQGIEYFVALRRLNKPVWMLNYNGQPHNLSAGAVANRLDLSKRMKQFFDHYLKEQPAPEWMINGIPATEKGKNLGY